MSRTNGCRSLLQNIVYKRLCFYNQETLRRNNTTNQGCGWSRSAPDTELRVLCCLACAVLHVPVLCSFSMPSSLSFHPKPSTLTPRPPSLTPKPSTLNPQTTHPQPYPYFLSDPLFESINYQDHHIDGGESLEGQGDGNGRDKSER